MQAVSADDEKLAQTMFLPLAERMVEKMVKEEKIEAEAEVSVAFPGRFHPRRFQIVDGCRSRVDIWAESARP